MATSVSEPGVLYDDLGNLLLSQERGVWNEMTLRSVDRKSAT
jgi:hypothetical protein